MTADVAASFGQEIAQLRAEVLRLQTQVTLVAGDASHEQPGGRRRGLPLARAPERAGLRRPVRSPGRPVAADRWPSSCPGDPRPTRPTVPSTCRDMGPPGRCSGPTASPTTTTVIVDDLTAEVAALLARAGPRSVRFLSDAEGRPIRRGTRLAAGRRRRPVGVHVPGEPAGRAAPPPRLRLHGLPARPQ